MIVTGWSGGRGGSPRTGAAASPRPAAPPPRAAAAACWPSRARSSRCPPRGAGWQSLRCSPRARGAAAAAPPRAASTPARRATPITFAPAAASTMAARRPRPAAPRRQRQSPSARAAWFALLAPPPGCWAPSVTVTRADATLWRYARPRESREPSAPIVQRYRGNQTCSASVTGRRPVAAPRPRPRPAASRLLCPGESSARGCRALLAASAGQSALPAQQRP